MSIDRIAVMLRKYGLIPLSILFILFVLPNGMVRCEDQISLQLAWRHQFQFAGYYAARHKGFYQQAGLEVSLVEGGEGRFAREELINGNAQYGVAGSELLLHRAEGDPFVVLAPIFQHSPSILLSKKSSGISSIQGLIGKRVMLLPGKKDADILAAFLNEGVPIGAIRRIDQTYNLEDLIEGRTDAVSAYLTNEPWHLLRQGIEPMIISPQTYGVDFYADCLFTTEQEISTHPERVNAFLSASLKGWAYAMDHPEEMVDLIRQQYRVEKSREHLLYEARAIRQIMSPDLVQVGHMNPGRWQHIAAVYAKLDMIDPGFSLDGFMYDPSQPGSYGWVMWALGATVMICLVAATLAFVLFNLNHKLKAEILEREQMAGERQEHIYLLESMNRINSVIQASDEPEHKLESVLKETLSIFNCDRAWLLHPCDPDAASFKVPFEATNPDFPGAAQLDATIPMIEPFKGDMLDALGTDKPITYGPGNQKPLSVPAPGEYHVRSQMFMAIRPQKGVPWMFGLHQCASDRVWTLQEKRIFSTIGRRISDALNSMLYQREMIEMKNLMDSVVEQSPIPIAVADLEGRLRIVNPACKENLGMEDTDILGLHLQEVYEQWETLTPGGRILEVQELPLAKAIKGGRVTEQLLRVVRKDGSSRWVVASAGPVQNDQGRQIASQIVFPDVTELKEIEAALQQSEEKYRLIFDESPMGIMYFDQTGTITDCNQKFADIMSASKNALIGFNIIESMPDSPLRQEVDHTIRTGAAHFEGECRTVEGTGHKFIKSDHRAILDGDGSFQGAVGVYEDVTDRKEAEQEKIEAQNIASEHKKMALVGQIAGKMAHDFNNILGIVMGNTELALVDCKDENTRRILGIIQQQTVRGKNLTKNLVAFAKDQEPKQAYFRVGEKIDLVLNLLKKELEGISLTREDSPGIPDLLADPGMIEHALVNLIQNSVHATSLSDTPQINIGTGFIDDEIRIRIEDNGCGIPQQALSRIYEPAFTLKGSMDGSGVYKAGIRGTGYGMANVKKYIEQHNGTIDVSSTVGAGTVFTISLPVIQKELTRKEKEVITERITQYEKYILLVEDESAISDVQYTILTEEPCNHRVDIAHTGKMAMDLFDRNTYDFVSLDYILPGDANGMDVYHHIRTSDQDMPILFISGNIEFLESIHQLREMDPNIDHVSKPCPNQKYISRINNLLERVARNA